MKRGSKLLIRVPGCPEFGPVAWTQVREWVADTFLLPSDEMRLAQESDWVPISSDPDVCNGKQDAMRSDWSRKRELLGPRATNYLKTLGCPIPFDRLNRATARNWADILEGKYPERANEVESWATKTESFGETPTALPTDPTTKQIQYLRSIGVELPPDATRRDASRVIGGEATEGQVRRLKFYGTYKEGLSKDEASQLIDEYVRVHPESELAYQAVRERLIAVEPQSEVRPFAVPGRPPSQPKPAVQPQRQIHGSDAWTKIVILILVIGAVLLLLKIVAYKSR